MYVNPRVATIPRRPTTVPLFSDVFSSYESRVGRGSRALLYTSKSGVNQQCRDMALGLGGRVGPRLAWTLGESLRVPPGRCLCVAKARGTGRLALRLHC